MKNKNVEHTTIRNGNLFCTHCGGTFVVKYPVPPEQLTEKIGAFNALHKHCEKTWTEPAADQSKQVQERALWWISNGEVGMSSKTMWNKFMGQPVGYPNHPHDPDDFKRCYKLLKTVPEWKYRMDELKPLSKAWSNLVDNWDRLTEMYELNVKTEWKQHKKIGMYDLMQKLTNP